MALKVRALVLHLSASIFGDAEQIKRWHIAQGWSTIGYHGVILNGVRHSESGYVTSLDGVIQPGRDERIIGAHCKAGSMNSVALGCCCIGSPGFTPKGAKLAPDNVTTHRYLTMAQFNSLIHWIRTNCIQYGLDPHGKFEHPFTGKIIPVITQHSDHEKGKPLCASLNMEVLRSYL